MRFPCFRDWLCPSIIALLLAGCAEPPPLRIGFLAELSGRSADLGEAARNGVTDQHGYSQAVRRTVGRWVNTQHRRRPMIIPVVIEA